MRQASSLRLTFTIAEARYITSEASPQLTPTVPINQVPKAFMELVGVKHIVKHKQRV